MDTRCTMLDTSVLLGQPTIDTPLGDRSEGYIYIYINTRIMRRFHAFGFQGLEQFLCILPNHYQILSIHTLESGKSGLKNGFACIFVKKHKSLEFHKASILFFRRKSLSGEIMFL